MHLIKSHTRRNRMSLIDPNAEVGTNEWDLLRFVLRFFS